MAARRRNRAKRVPRGQGASRWPAFLAGCATGAAAAFFIDAADLPRLQPGGGAPDSAVADGEGAAAAPAKLRYDFYTILPEMEVALPITQEEDTQAALPDAASPPASVEDAPEKPSVAALGSEEERAEPDSVPAAPVVDATVAARAPEPSPQVVGAAGSGGTYILQVGSFRNEAEAERRRARLALLGLEARVQTIAIDGEATWHRVQVGPYDELGVLNDARVRLRENDIEAMALKVRSP